MATCPGPNCDTSITASGAAFQECHACRTSMHFQGGEAYLVPSLKDDRTRHLTPWSGSGPNLLRELNQYPPFGYLQTRGGVVLKITFQNQGRSTAGRQASWERARNELGRYGLDVTHFDPNDSDIFTKKADFLSAPCYLHLVGTGAPPLPPLEVSPPSPPPSPRTSKADTTWIHGQLLEMYPNQNLYDEQRKAIEHSVTNPGSLTSAILPTGLGKTRIAQALAISLARGHGDPSSREGPVLVVYPTISLMDDQKREWEVDLREDMQRAGEEPLRIRAIHSGIDQEKRDEINRMLLEDELDVILCSPENLTGKTSKANGERKIDLMGIAARLGGEKCRGRPFSALIVDEAHIVFDWGEGIRPSFLLLPLIEATLRKINPNLRTLLMTATLTPREEGNLIDRMSEGRDASLVMKVRRADVREDLAFTVEDWGMTEPTELSDKILQEYYRYHKWRTGPPNSNSPLLIYTGRRQACKDIAHHLSNRVGRGNWEVYHGSTPTGKRASALRRFQDDEIQLMVATSAFGMGVNKPNIWLIAYVGKPSNLRELYQAFGRAARQSNWDGKTGKTPLNGNCIALISHRQNHFFYKPTFKPPKQMERFLPMVSGGEVTDNGYLLLSLTPSTPHIFWNPFDEAESRNQKNDEENKQRNLLLRRPGYDPTKIDGDLDVWWSTRYQDLLRARMKSERDKWLKAVIYPTTAGYLRIVGIYPGEPVVSDDYGSLKEMLEQGGEGRVLEAYGDIEWGGTQFNTGDYSLYLVAKVLKPISGFDDYLSAFQEGQDESKKWVEDDLGELKEFLKSDDCIRQRFSGVVGAQPKSIESCAELFSRNQNNPLPSGTNPVVPCSVCRGKLWPVLDPSEAPDSNLRYNGDPALTTWLDAPAIEYLSGRSSQTAMTSVERLDGDCRELPYEGFQCGFSYGEKNLHSDEIKERWMDLYDKHGKHVFFDEVYDVDGTLLDSGDFSLDLVDLHQQTIVGVSFQGVPNSYPYGGLIYKNQNGIYCRFISRDRAATVFEQIRKKVTSRSDHDEFCKIFIGRNKPNIYGSPNSVQWCS